MRELTEQEVDAIGGYPLGGAPCREKRNPD